MIDTAARRAMRYQLDRNLRRFGNVLIGGSPLTLLRLSDAGVAALDRIAADQPVGRSTLVDRLVELGAIHPAPARSTRWRGADVTIVTPVLGPLRGAPAGALIVDDGSLPPVPGADVRLDRNAGPAAARNAGLALVTTPLVAFVDDGVTLPEGWLAALLGHFDDPDVVLVAPRIASAPGPSRLARYERRRSPLDLGPHPALVAPGSTVSYVPAAAIVCRTDAVRHVGGFDESLRYGEDVDVVWRLVAHGWRCRYEPSVIVVHAPRPTWAAWMRQRLAYAGSAAPLARRHGAAVTPVRVSVWGALTSVAFVGRRPLLGLGATLGAAMTARRALRGVPPGAAAGLVLRGNVGGALGVATGVRRAWWPALLAVAPWSRVARRTLALSAIASGDPLRVVDDAVSAIGVWRGVVAERSLVALAPTISGWPVTRRRRAAAC